MKQRKKKKIAYKPNNTEAPFLTGTLYSLAGHLLAALLVIFSGPKMGEFGKPIVYSVSIEGGKKLGGIQQLAQTDKAQMAPPKNVSATEPKGSEKAAEKKEEQKVETKSEKAEDAEISLQEKKPTPQPSVKATEAVPKTEATPPKSKGKGEEEEGKGKEKGKKGAKDMGLSQAEDKQLQSAMQRYLGESSNAGGEGFGAAALGPGNGMGGGVVRPPEFFQYFNLLKNHVYQNWRWPGNALRLAVIRFNIAEDGRISEVRIEKSSGDSYYDDLAYRAVLKANPVPPPPRSVYEFFRDTRFHFDSKGNAQVF
ncbi:MAG: TonB family protein [SAR324 cluster bacterium]|uniref:TonB family protein n=1 Tax=SAR324 cluster bacterium TaxID=2024889 RepID=A0A7X9FTZ9_9DELT|nr:TonB family protein [SAR324 cluster bacterium]